MNLKIYHFLNTYIYLGIDYQKFFNVHNYIHYKPNESTHLSFIQTCQPQNEKSYTQSKRNKQNDKQFFLIGIKSVISFMGCRPMEGIL